jgi:hypothetical protein
MKLTFCVYGLAIVGGNNFLYDFKKHEIHTFSFWQQSNKHFAKGCHYFKIIISRKF